LGNLLEVKDLHVSVEGRSILQGFSIKVKPGEIHAIMGPNGAGKSTLANVLGGHPRCQVKKGRVLFQGKDLLRLLPEERAHLGLFMGFQHPIEVAGVSNFQFLFSSCNAQRKARGQELLMEEDFRTLLKEKMNEMEMEEAFNDRPLNEGFSGGEKKRNEILQLLLLQPTLAILDETDSGLDIDAMRVIADGVNRYVSKERGLILITHYQRLLEHIRPHFVHVMIGGRIVQSDGPELALSLEKEGYEGRV
jgi:Fe-S cluster assembly ATP-binding protein